MCTILLAKAPSTATCYSRVSTESSLSREALRSCCRRAVQHSSALVCSDAVCDLIYITERRDRLSTGFFSSGHKALWWARNAASTHRETDGPPGELSEPQGKCIAMIKICCIISCHKKWSDAPPDAVHPLTPPLMCTSGLWSGAPRSSAKPTA